MSGIDWRAVRRFHKDQRRKEREAERLKKALGTTVRVSPKTQGVVLTLVAVIGLGLMWTNLSLATAVRENTSHQDADRRELKALALAAAQYADDANEAAARAEAKVRK